jgi:acid phosphatase
MYLEKYSIDLLQYGLKIKYGSSPSSYVLGRTIPNNLLQDFTKVDQNSDIVDLARQGILLTEYYGLTHPSQPNYIASIGGDYFGLNHDGFVTIPQNVSTLVDLLDTKNINWRGYFEGLPGPGFMAEGSTAFDGSGWDYVRKHK